MVPSSAASAGLVGLPAEALASEPDERRAVAVVGLEAAGAELGPRRLRLGRGEQAHPAGKAPLELGRPGTVQGAGRLDRDQRLAGDAAALDEALELVDALVKRRQRDGLSDEAAVTARQPDPVRDLAGIDRDDERLDRESRLNRLDMNNLL